jgi:hypothetical protein
MVQDRRTSEAAMAYLHNEFELGPDDTIEVLLDHAANVQLLDPMNYEAYRSGRAFRYLGGYVRKSPYALKAPRPGKWHLVVDLGGGTGAVRATARIISTPSEN